MIDGRAISRLHHASRKLEFYSKTMSEWKWPEHTLPGYMRSHVHWRDLDQSKGEFILVPTFRLPTLDPHEIRKREVALRNLAHKPAVDESERCRAAGLQNGRPRASEHGDRPLRHSRLGDRRDQARRGCLLASPGPVAVETGEGTDRWASALVEMEELGEGRWRLRQIEGVRPFKSDDPDSERIFWQEGGVHQNLTFPVHPDPVSGMHCWHQRFGSRQAGPMTSTEMSSLTRSALIEIYRKWLEMAGLLRDRTGCAGRFGSRAR